MPSQCHFRLFPVTMKNLKWRLGIVLTPFTAVPTEAHYTVVYPLLAGIASLVTFTLLFCVLLPLEAILPIVRLGIVGGITAAITGAKEFNSYVADKASEIKELMLDYYQKAKDKAWTWMQISCFLLIPIGLMFVGIFFIGVISSLRIRFNSSLINFFNSLFFILLSYIKQF